MIFKWEDYFSEKLLDEGFNPEIKVMSVTRLIDYISAIVEEKNETYIVSIDIDDNFQIESCECECGKAKCHHMTALIYALNDTHNKDVEYDMILDKLDSDKLMNFLKNQLTYNEELLDEFKDNFRQDILHHEILSYDDEIFTILDGYDWVDELNTFVENELMECYENEENKYTLYLITLFFDKLIDRHCFDEDADLNNSWNTVVDLIKKIAVNEEELVFDFLYECLKHNYSAMYPPFIELMKFFDESFHDKKFLKQKFELLM